nr:response regulator [uncultured Anaerosporobacter sp.]
MLKMIIADDESIILRGIRKLVDWNELGINIVEEYTDGKEALLGILAENPDIALLDINMPGLNGIEILKYITTKEEINTKVIFISGFQEFEYAKAAIKYGVTEYLLKPVIVEELLNAVEKIIHEINREKDISKPAQEISQETPVNYHKLVDIPQENYIPVYTEILFTSEVIPQVKKLVTFSFLSYLEKYLEENEFGIVFKKSENIAIILKGEDKKKAKDILYQIVTNAKEVMGHQVAFIMGEVVDCMSKIPESYSRCLEWKGYLFFHGEIKAPILVYGEPVSTKKAVWMN